MAERFIGLHEFLVSVPEREEELVEPAIAVPENDAPPESSEAVAEARRFRAAVYDAVDVAVGAILCDIATDVLARELAIAPAQLDAIVARACERYAAEGVVRVRVHPDEAVRIACADVKVVGDATLRRGDAILEVRSGTIDVTLGARLADVLERVAS